MEIKIPKSTAPRPDITRIKGSKEGTVTLIDEARLKEAQTKESINLMQEQDGVWKTRWGRSYYGESVGGTDIDGAFEYILDRGEATEERQIIVIRSDGVVRKSIDDGATWSTVTGATFTGGYKMSGIQIERYLYLANGEDVLTRYDGTNLTQYTEIDVPTGLALGRTVLTTGAYTAYYQVSALNEVGETEGCAEVSIAINKLRSDWTASESVDLTWTAVTGAIRYQIYYSDSSGYEELLGESATNSFSDVGSADGAAPTNPYIVTPVDNTTSAPKFTHISLSGNRIWGLGDKENPYRAYFTGVGQYMGYFGAYYGGGWIDIAYGSRNIVVGSTNYRTGKGDEITTIFTRTPEGTGTIWQVALDIATAGELTFTLPIPTMIVDYIGCTSADAIVSAGDKVFFPNINGIFDLGNKEQIFNILVSNEISQAIRPSYRSLSEEGYDNMCAYFYDAKVFFSASKLGDENDIIFIYDTERKNWTYYWTFGAKKFLEVTDTNNERHLVYVPETGNQLIEISKDLYTDFGEAYSTSYVSGILPFDDRLDLFAKVYQAIIEFGRLKGKVTIEIYGEEKERGFRTLISREFTTTGSVVDFVGELYGDYLFSNGSEAGEVYTLPTIKKRLRIDKRLNRIQIRISSVESGTRYTILGAQVNGRLIPMSLPNKWRN